MSDKKQWYEKRTWVVIWLIFCLPIGLFGLIKNHKFKARTKWILGTIFVLIFASLVNGSINSVLKLEREAKEAGYQSYLAYSEAKELGIESPEEYQKYKNEQRQREEEIAAQEQQKKEEAKRLKEEKANSKIITLPDGQEIFETLAVNLCKDEIKDQLSSPSSAKFPRVFSGDYTLPVKEGNTFTYRNYVEAPNSFGVMLRKNYVCVIDGDANRIVANFEE